MSGRSPRWIALPTDVKAGALPGGSIVKFNESGSLAEFYVAKHDYESDLNGSGRTLIVRKDCYDMRAFGGKNAYANSSLDSWLCNTYLKLLDADIQTAIGTTKFYYTPGNGNTTVTTLERAVFQLSITELGKNRNGTNTEGSALPIASTLQIAHRNGSACTQWTRTPGINTNTLAGYIRTNGNAELDISSNSSCGSRPAFTIPSNFRISPDLITYPAA